MATRLERVLRIVIRLQSGHGWNVQQLALETGVHRRTIFRDIASLRTLGFPIAYDPETACYSLKAACLLNPDDLSVDELGELLLAACLALRSGRLVQGAIEKLTGRLPADRREAINALSELVHAEAWTGHDGSSRAMEAILVALRRQQELFLMASGAFERPSPHRVKVIRIAFTATESMLICESLDDGRILNLRLAQVREAWLGEKMLGPNPLARPHFGNSSKPAVK